LDGYLLALIILVVWIAIVLVGHRFKFWGNKNVSLYGPLLMIKTQRGKEFLNRMARPTRFWGAYGRISIWICIASMALLMFLLVWEAFLIFRIPASAAPSPEMALALPGINPIIPLWYGIIGIAIAVFVHEIAHGIMSRVARIKVESMGLLFLVIPMGAFVEPNENEIKKTTPHKRGRLYAAGPATNVILGLICLFLLASLIAPAAKPISEGAIIAGIGDESPASYYGLGIWCEITSVDGNGIGNAKDIENLSFEEPGKPVIMGYLYRGEQSEIEIPGGVVITGVLEGPAFNAGIKPGMIIESLNGTIIHNTTQFRTVIENETHNNSINITVLSYSYDFLTDEYGFFRNDSIINITLTTKWLYYYKYNPNENKEDFKNVSYMGVTSAIFGVRTVDSDYVSKIYNEPFGQINEPADFFSGSLRLIALPFLGLTPIESPISDLYEPTGALSFLPNDIYWGIINCLYWIFWMNLLLGLFNALPAIPLDGGYVLKDLLKVTAMRLKKAPTGLDRVIGKKPFTEDQLDRLISTIVIVASLIVFFLIIWQFIGPRFFGT